MAGLNEMGEGDLRQRLLDFDRAVALLHPDRMFRLVIVGGGAMVLLGCLARSTEDIDVLQFPSELVPLMAKYGLSCQVAAYEDQFAYGLEDRVVDLGLPARAVRCYSASVEDIVASKLYSDRPSDGVDVRRPEVIAAIDWDRLAEVVADMHGSVLIERRHREFIRHYELYRKECGPCDD